MELQVLDGGAAEEEAIDFDDFVESMTKSMEESGIDPLNSLLQRVLTDLYDGDWLSFAPALADALEESTCDCEMPTCSVLRDAARCWARRQLGLPPHRTKIRSIH